MASQPKATRETERVAKASIRGLTDDLEESTPEEVDAAASQMSLKPIRAWKSRRFIVQLFPEIDHGQRLTVQRTGANGYIRPQNRDTRPLSWDELMEVKARCGFAHRWAVEIYPAADETVFSCLMRHLFFLEAPPSFAWRKG